MYEFIWIRIKYKTKCYIITKGIWWNCLYCMWNVNLLKNECISDRECVGFINRKIFNMVKDCVDKHRRLSILHILRYWCAGDSEDKSEALPDPLISEQERDTVPDLAWIKPSELSWIYSTGLTFLIFLCFNTLNFQLYEGLCFTNPAVWQIHVLYVYLLSQPHIQHQSINLEKSQIYFKKNCDVQLWTCFTIFKMYKYILFLNNPLYRV